MAINLPIVSKFNDAGVKAAERSLGNFGRFAANTAAAATTAIAGIAAFSIREFGNFDSALQQSVSIMGDVSDALRNDMADAAREVAKTTTFSAEQAAESFYFLASAGLDAEASITAMPRVAQFAQAGMFDMARATDLLTDAQSALGLTIRDDAIANMEEMTRVSDVLVRANTLANASVEQFSTALTTKAGAALRGFGIDMEEGVAVLAAFADQGIKGEIAGTQLSIVLRDLSTKAIKNKEEFEKLGVAVFDSEGEFRNLGDIIGDLETALFGMSDETQKATLLQMGFSDKSLQSLQALMGTSEQIKIYEDALRDANGITDEVANKQLESFNSQMELLKSKLADVAIEIGSQLAPKLQDLLTRLEPLIDEAAPVLIDLFDKIWMAAEDIGEFLKPLIDDALPGLKSIFESLEEPLGNVVDFFTTLAETILKKVTDLIADERFQDAVKTIAESFGEFAEEAKRLVESGLVNYLLDLTGASIIGGLRVLEEALTPVVGALTSLNNILDLLSGKTPTLDKIFGGLKITGLDFEKIVGGFVEEQQRRFLPPRFADGGIVPARSGGTLGIIGEAGQSEAVIPLDRLERFMGDGGSKIAITVNAGMGADGQDIGRKIVDEIIRYERASGRVFARA